MRSQKRGKAVKKIPGRIFIFCNRSALGGLLSIGGKVFLTVIWTCEENFYLKFVPGF
jgi:hypothetical protein